MKKKKDKNYIYVIATVTVLCITGIYIFYEKNKNDKNQTSKNIEVIEEMPEEKKDVFEDFYIKANEKIGTLSLDEKIGQIFLARYPEKNAIEEQQKYSLGGYILFEKDFKNKTEEEIKTEIQKIQENSKIPLLIAVDEEGGRVVRVSSNQNLANEKFKSPNELYNLGGFEKIKEDTIEKSEALYNLGINLNLAPVVDVSTEPGDYMYERTLGENTELTSVYAKTVIEASKKGKVSYTLKHFPGYGNNTDTHTGIVVDSRVYQEIVEYDLPPFKAGIDVEAEAVLVSHNVVTSIDKDNPASLSKEVHRLLREELGFTGVIITDDLAMGAVKNEEEAVIKAVTAGNDLIIVTDYAKSIQTVKKAVEDGKLSESQINELAFRVLAWKYYKEML